MSLDASGNEIKTAPRLVRACRGVALDRPPVWFMRQAGRYMAEYRAVREKVSFLDLCKNPDLAAEVSLQPYEAFGVDGVIMFSDILIPTEPMGMNLVFNDHGPQFLNPVRTAQDVARLVVPDPVLETGFVMDLIQRLRQQLATSPDTALIGFAGAPWTLAAYMVEGGVTKNFTTLAHLMYHEPAVLHQLLSKLTQTVIQYLNAQIAAGVQVVQLFDTWGGILDEAGYREFIQPYQQQVIAGLNRQETPVILYVKGSGHLLEAMAETQPDVISLDWLTPLSKARKRLGATQVLQGNLDPLAMLAPWTVLEQKVEAMLLEGGPQGYIVNVGHGLLPQTPVENVKQMVTLVKRQADKPTLVMV